MLLFFGVPYLGARITVRASGGRAGIFYGFSSEGFSAKSDLAATTFPWQAVRGARETGGFMFIEFQGWAVTIPVRQITGDQAEQLGGLLRIHVLKNVKLAKR
jgi:hypothetical protein